MASTHWQRLVGDTIDGKYLLHKLLGFSPSGATFDASPLSLEIAHQHVALKLTERAAGHEEQQLLEITGLAGLTHPSLIRSFTPGICIVDRLQMLYLPAEMGDESLDARLGSQPLSLDETRDIGTALSAALAYLHEQHRPLVHRNIKPSNAMRIGARWKLGDFGLIRSVPSSAGVRERSFTGTTEYAPPESYDGLISPAWDIWSLGILLHEAATGRHPFHGSNSHQDLQQAVCFEQPDVSEELPGAFIAMLRACLAGDPSARWSAARVLEELEELDTGGSYPLIPHGHGARRRHTLSEPVAAHAETHVDSARTDILYGHISVSPTGDADCSTIIEAVRRAASGATIQVRPGHYSGTLLLERPVEIVGDGAAAEIVVQATGREALIIDSGDVRVCGLTITSRSEMNQPRHHGVLIRVGPAKIEECDISCSSMACIAVLPGAAGIKVSACTIHDGKSAGVLFEEGASGEVADSTLTANFGPALHLKSGGKHVLRACRISDGRECGVLVDRAAECSIQSCLIHDNQGAGVLLQESCEAAILDCAIFANKHAGVAARARSKATITDCDIHSNVLSGATFSGSEAHLLRCNLHDSRSNGIAVSDGAECSLEESEVFGNGFAGIKVSHAGILRVRASHLHTGKRNAGVIQDDAYAAFTGCDIHDNGQVAIRVEEGGRADIVECRLHTSEEGCISYSGAGTVERCDLTDNGKSAVEILHGGSATIRGCSLVSNRMPAILVHHKAEAVIERCDISRNEMPGIAIGEFSKALISECTIQSGAQVGIVFWDHAKGIMDRCEVTGCGMDGVRIMLESDPVITGSRVHANGIYGIHVSGKSGGEIMDCDLTGNKVGPVLLEAGCTTQSSGNLV